jgi:O-antigen/teichoic acid export membrane protein
MHKLAPEEFGLATLALSVQTMVMVLQPVTLGDVLLAQPGEIARVAATASRLCLITSLAFAVGIVVSGPWAAAHYHSRGLMLGCAFAALRPLSEWTIMLPLTRLRAKLRFRTISAVDAGSLIGASLTSVAMAWAGCGFASVILPQIAFTVVRAELYRRASPAPPSPRWLPQEVPTLFRKFVLSGLGQYVHGGLISLAPLIVGSFTGQREVGWYTMAFTLSTQINTVVGFSMSLVLQPIFAHMAHDPPRQSSAFLRACRVIATVAMPACLIQIVLVPVAFKLFLPAKWEGAIVLTQILTLGQAFFFCVNPAMGLLKAQSRFAAFMVWQTVQLAVVVAAMWGAGVLWRQAPLFPIVLVGGLYHILSAPIGVWIAVRERGASLASSLDVFLRPFVLAAISVLPIAWVVFRIVPASVTRDVIALAIIPLVSVAISVLLVQRFDRMAAEDCGRLVRGVIRRVQWRTANAT